MNNNPDDINAVTPDVAAADGAVAESGAKDASPSDTTSEFHSVTSYLDKAAPSLTKAQKRYMKRMANNARHKDIFHHTHPDLKHHEVDFKPTEHHIEAMGEIVHDDKPFDFSEKALDSHHPTLTEAQKQFLLRKQAEADERGFQEVNDYFQEEGFGLTEEQLRDLYYELGSRSRALHKHEFDTVEGLLKTEEISRAHGKDTEIIEKPLEVAQISEADEDALMKAAVLDVDKTELQLLAPAPETKLPKRDLGLITRVAKYANVKHYNPFGPRKKRRQKDLQLPVVEAVGVAFLGILVASIIIVPPKLRGAADGPEAEGKARQNLSAAIHDDLQKDVPQEAQQLPSGTINHPFSPTVDWSTNEDPSDYWSQKSMGPVPDKLRYARYLAFKGFSEAAVPYYESYVNICPQAVPVRLELINIYLKLKKWDKARELCITTFKQKLTNTETEQLWALWRKCLLEA